MKHNYLKCVPVLLCLLSVFRAYPLEKVIIVNEGNWQTDNGSLSYFEDGRIVSTKWFRDVNGYKLGDTPNDIIQLRDNLIAISINWSNIVQFIDDKGKAVAATEDVPNNRKLATDGNFVYVTSYGHECNTVNGMMYFTKGYVAKIDINTFKVVDAVEVGYEPEGIACYKGHLFVANSGGYAFQEDHSYETTVSVIDATTMKVVRTVDTGQINLYGNMSRSGSYLCISSNSDYYEKQSATVIFDCQAVLDGKPDRACFVTLEYASTYNCTAADGCFWAIGSRYSYLTGDYTFDYITIDPVKVVESDGINGVAEGFPGSVLSDLKKFTMPYGIYVNPYTGYIYASDTGNYVAAGTLHQWDPEGRKTGSFKIYINPGHFLALPPDGHFGGIADLPADNVANADSTVYNLQGIRVDNPTPGQIYIRAGKKFIAR